MVIWADGSCGPVGGAGDERGFTRLTIHGGRKGGAQVREAAAPVGRPLALAVVSLESPPASANGTGNPGSSSAASLMATAAIASNSIAPDRPHWRFAHARRVLAWLVQMPPARHSCRPGASGLDVWGHGWGEGRAPELERLPLGGSRQTIIHGQGGEASCPMRINRRRAGTHRKEKAEA